MTALIECDDLFHAAEAELLSIRLRNVVRRHFRIGPAEHGHHLTLDAVGLSRNLGAGLAHAELGEKPFAVLTRKVVNFACSRSIPAQRARLYRADRAADPQLGPGMTSALDRSFETIDSKRNLFASGRPQEVITASMPADVYGVDAVVEHTAGGGLHIRSAERPVRQTRS
ncbi:hypothetical protein [Bradyrhizobium liaoningense]|uniref:hypothetical protein n=1 Tax=Bradyrhizobium liaoningense TaxID=43992 RepID=UPI0024E05803|nr:hypothetical protein [Bradyrhizobium liaoningense]